MSVTYLGLILGQIVTEALRSGSPCNVNGAAAPFCTRTTKTVIHELAHLQHALPRRRRFFAS
jgi:hypothetical protein